MSDVCSGHRCDKCLQCQGGTCCKRDRLPDLIRRLIKKTVEKDSAVDSR